MLNIDWQFSSLHSVTFFTDNQNAACIIKKGRKIPELQTLALLIYSKGRK
jgi:fumarate reductase subunit C